MRHKVFLFIVLLLFLPMAAQAQSVRVVRGAIMTEDGTPLRNAIIVTDKGSKFDPQEDGSFEIRVPTTTKRLYFKAEGYVTISREIDGLYMLVKMAVDQDAVKKAEQEAKVREEQAKKAEAERLAAEEKARKDAEAKMKAAEEARIKAEKERQAAEMKAQKNGARQKKDAFYNEQYRNKGLEHAVDISYSYPFYRCNVMYHYSGYKEYGTLHPFELDYTLSYRINRLFSVGAGAGVLFHARSLTIVNDSFSPVYGEFKERRFDVPVFGAVKITPLRKRFRPVIGGACGYYLLSHTLMWEGDLGGEWRISRRIAAHICLSACSTPYPYFNETEGKAGYLAAISPSVKVGFTF